MASLRELPNIGAVVEGELCKVGLDTAEKLRAAGAQEAFLRIRLLVDPGACLSKLMGLHGAVLGVRWHDLPPEEKLAMKAFYKSL